MKPLKSLSALILLYPLMIVAGILGAIILPIAGAVHCYKWGLWPWQVLVVDVKVLEKK